MSGLAEQKAMENYLSNDIDTEQANITSQDEAKNNKSGPTPEVVVWMWINALDDIKMSEECFYCDFDLIFFWLPSPKDRNANGEEKVVWEDDSLKFFYHNFTLVNCIQADIRLQNQGKMENGGNDPYDTKLAFNEWAKDYSYLNYVKYSIKGTFKERFELYNFPFDVQDLQIHLQYNMHKDTSRLNCVFDKSKYFLHGTWLADSTIGPNVHLDEYAQEGFQIVNYCSVNEFDHVEFKIKIARKFGVYFWKVGIYMLILTLSSIGVFCMNNDVDSVDQLALLFTLLLTGVALQFVVGSWLPVLSYVTLLDEYIIVSFLTMFLVVVFIYIFDIFEIDLTDETKITLTIILFLTFILSQILFGVLFYVKRKEEMKKIESYETSFPIEGSENNNDEKKSPNMIAKIVLHT